MPEESMLPVKNTFIHFEFKEDDQKLRRTSSAPAILITEQKTEDREEIHQKLKELIDNLNPTNGSQICFEKYLAEEFKKKPNDFDFSQFDFLKCNVSKFGLNQEKFDLAVASLDQMKNLYDFLNQNKGKTITREQLETHTTPTTYCTKELVKHFRLYYNITNDSKVIIPNYETPHAIETLPLQQSHQQR